MAEVVGWRIVKEKHAKTAFSGEGARIFEGRWNSAGVRMVYCSEHLSLAALEILPLEKTFLLNPKHRDFGKIKIKDNGSFVLDQRLR